MAHRNPPAPDFDPSEDEALAAAIEDYERERRVLAEISEIARDLADGVEQYAKARAEVPGAADAEKPPFDHAASLAELARTIRLNDALDAKLAAALKARIDRASAEAARRRRGRDQARKTGGGATLH